jgi:hypothetical protein
MAVTPYFVLSPNTILSIIGFVHGPDRTVPTPAEDWRRATVDVVIPAFNEERGFLMLGLPCSPDISALQDYPDR